MPVGSSLKLVTIGETDTFPIRSPALDVAAMTEDDIEMFMKTNFAQLPNEVRRFVSQHSAGNVRHAILLASRINEVGEVEAAELIQRSDIEQLTRGLLPEGRPFLVASILALFERVGWDREVASQLELLARFAGADQDEFRLAGRQLEDRGLLVRQGRYRAITPHPLAVFLAADAWREYGPRLMEELFPTLDREMATSLLGRMADLGRYEPAQRMVRHLIDEGDLFRSMESIEEHDLATFLVQFAIVAPEETMARLKELIMTASIPGLKALQQSRRNLVWTLEKLAWHRRTFEDAADCLLRLSLAENETYGNNASGVWTSLFGAVLPATAALPEARLEYLRERATDSDPAIRSLVVHACAAALQHHEAVSVSGELQEGAFVEPRGGVKTYAEASAFHAELIEILSAMARDSDDAIAQEASNTLISSVLPLIDDDRVNDALIPALAGLTTEPLARLRQEIVRLRAMANRTDSSRLAAGLERLIHALPEEDSLEELRTLLSLQPWDLQDDELSARLDQLVETAVANNQLETVLSWLDKPQPAAWFLGASLGAHIGYDRAVLDAMLRRLDANLAALAGYMHSLVEDGDLAAFDTLLDGEDAAPLSPSTQLALTVRGPASDAANRRIRELAKRMSPFEAATGLFGWWKNLVETEVSDLIEEWLPRISTQGDYNAVIDAITLWLHPDKSISDNMKSSILELLEKRRAFSEMGNQAWDWGQLAERYISTNALIVARVILDLVADGLIMIDGSEEAELLLKATASAPEEVWTVVADRLEGNDWRLAMVLRGWFTRAVPLAVLDDWIGASIERARLLATIAEVGETEPSDTAQLLLARFGDDDEVRAALMAEFWSGSWSGPESNRIARQVEILEDWRSRTDASSGLRDWASALIRELEDRRANVIEREAEERW
jgi:hypothetical protein